MHDADIASHVAACAACAELARSRQIGLRATALDSETAAAIARTDDADSTSLAIGGFVGGRYRVVRFIARGGMGEVYEAFDEELRVRVALKIATRSTGVALDRFRREVLLARRVTHHNVCRLFEIGFEPIGNRDVPYCTMELLEGTTLSERLVRGPLTASEARAIVQQIAAGLQAAHDVGVIHRDFKSNNILLVRDGEGRERAVISDFGLARASTPITDDGTALTSEQALIGTPAYMAPEQVECKPVSAASDIYALGVVMFEMLTGELPFRADTPMATAVLRLTQPAPSVRSRRTELSAAWDSVIARCLELDPAKRFSRANDVAAALDGGPPARPWRTIAASIAGVAALAFALADPIDLSALQPANAAAPIALPAATTRTLIVLDPTTDRDAWRATAEGELLRAELRVPGRVSVVNGYATARLARDLMIGASPPAHATIVRLAAVTPAQLLLTGALRGDQLEVRLIDLASGRPVATDREPVPGGDLAAATARLGDRLRRLLAGADVVLDADHAAKVLPAAPEAARQYAEGLTRARALDHHGAITALSRVTELAPDFGLAYIALVGELRAGRQTIKATAAAKRAFELAGGLRSDERLRAEAIYRESRGEFRLAADLWSTLLAAEPDNTDVAMALARAHSFDHHVERCYESLDAMRRRPPPVGDDPRLDLQEAWCAGTSGDFRRALSAATRADIKAGVRGSRDVQAEAVGLEGQMLANAGEYNRAVSVLERAKQLNEALHDDKNVFEAIRQLAYVLGEQGKNVEAERAYAEALEVARKMDDRLGEGIVLNDYGQFVPRAEDALAMFRKGLVIARELNDDRLITALLLNLANKLDAVGQVEEAVTTYREVIERATAQQDGGNLSTAQMNMGDSLIKLNRPREALPLIDQALASFKERGDEDGVGYALLSRGDAHWQTGDLKGAREDLEASLALRIKLDEQRNIAQSQDKLVRLDLAEDKAAAAEPLAQAALAERRREGDPEQTAAALVTLAHVLVVLGRTQEALAAVDEAERLAKPDPAQTTGPVSAIEIAFVRALAAPTAAADQLAIIRASARRPDCSYCPSEALLEEGQVERAAGHGARARVLLTEARRLAHAVHAEDLAARATRLLAN
ncbi:MAG TPA: serine/threonine-protein kinase [Kofleriaceae bacterium]